MLCKQLSRCSLLVRFKCSDIQLKLVQYLHHSSLNAVLERKLSGSFDLLGSKIKFSNKDPPKKKDFLFRLAIAKSNKKIISLEPQTARTRRMAKIK